MRENIPAHVLTDLKPRFYRRRLAPFQAMRVAGLLPSRGRVQPIEVKRLVPRVSFRMLQQGGPVKEHETAERVEQALEVPVTGKLDQRRVKVRVEREGGVQVFALDRAIATRDKLLETFRSGLISALLWTSSSASATVQRR